MSKTTFLGYVPSLKSKHEATIVGGKAIESKGGSIRYMLQGEYDGRKTLPKTVSKADFEGVYGFDAKEAEAVIITGKQAIGMGKRDIAKGYIIGKEDQYDFTPNQIATFPHKIGTANLENHADTVGSPSPASVEPPAPSETPFPQEPSNASFSAEDLECVECGKMGAIECDTCDDICEECHRNSWGQDGYGAMDMALGHLTTEQIAELYDEDPNDLEALLDEYSYQGNDEADAIYDRFVKSMHSKTETKEAFGFGKEDEEEAEPKTQEFTVVLQEGDKLELTDIEDTEEDAPEPKEEDSPEDEENEEKEAESNVRVFVVSSVDYETDGQEDLDLRQDFTFALDKDDIGDTTDMQEIADEIVDDISDETGFLVSGFYFQEKMPDGTLVDLDAESYEAESNQDIKWGDVKEMDNSKCPFCFRSAFRLIDEEGEEFSVYEEDIAGDNWLLECSRCKAEWNQDGENTLDGGYTGNAEVNENFSAEMEEWNYVQFEETPQGLIISLNRDLTSQSFDGDAADLLEDVRANSNWEWLTADQLGALSEADVLAQGSYSDDGEFEPAENVVYAYTDYQISDWFNKLKDNGVVVFKSFPVEKGAFYQDAEYEAVSAKVTRPVKEEEDEESEDGEGMSTLMKVGLGVGALAVGAAILGAEGEYSCPHCSIDLELDGLDMSEKFTCPDCEGIIYDSGVIGGGHYPGDFMAEDEGESDYWAGENADWRAEEFEASRHHGGDKKKKLMKDNYENKWKKNLNDRFNKKTIADEDLRDFKKHGEAENFSARWNLHQISHTIVMVVSG